METAKSLPQYALTTSADETTALLPASRRPRAPKWLPQLSVLCVAFLILVVVCLFNRNTTSHVPLSRPTAFATNRSHVTLIDEDSQPGDTISSEPKPRAWLGRAVADWMSQLPDSEPLAQVSLPGTHDTAAYVGGFVCETQSWSIADQLSAGIRFFDIRCRRAGNVFSIHHGVCFLDTFFGNVMAEVQQFLSAHPNEFLLMRVKEEHRPMEGSDTFESIWATYMRRFGYLFLDARNSLPTVGELRGRVLLLRTGFKSDQGIAWEGALTDIQDVYKVYFVPFDDPFGSDTASLPQKKELINHYIDKAATSSKLVLNFLSGSTGMLPKDVAESTNPAAYDHIGEYQGPKRLGVIIMDYPGERLVYRVIKSNYNSEGYCPPKTYRTQSDRTWAEFRMPRAIVGTTIVIEGGAYAKYVFPSCHRATWTDLRFVCKSNKRWETVSGSWDADGRCRSSNTKQPYLAVGDR